MILHTFALLELFVPDVAWNKSSKAPKAWSLKFLLQLVTAPRRSFKPEIAVSFSLPLTLSSLSFLSSPHARPPHPLIHAASQERGSSACEIGAISGQANVELEGGGSHSLRVIILCLIKYLACPYAYTCAELSLLVRICDISTCTVSRKWVAAREWRLGLFLVWRNTYLQFKEEFRWVFSLGLLFLLLH